MVDQGPMPLSNGIQTKDPSLFVTVACGGFIVHMLVSETDEHDIVRQIWEPHVFTTEQGVAEFIVKALRDGAAYQADSDAGEVKVSDIEKAS